MPTEYIGEWHTIVATADEGGMDFDVEHPATCPTRDNVGEPWACDLQAHFDAWGYHETVGILLGAPGTYRARYHCWPIPLAPHIASHPEWDEGVEVEAVIPDAC